MTDPRSPKQPATVRPAMGLAFLLLLPFLSACNDGGGNGDPDPEPSRVDSLALSPSSLSFDALGDTARITATVLDQYGEVFPDVTVLWASNDATIATVSPSGLVSSVRDGETEIRVQAGAERGSVSVTVSQKAELLETLEGNDQFQWTGFPLEDPLKIRVTDGAGTAVVGDEVTWDVLEGEGTILPDASRTNSEGEASAGWILGEGESGVQSVSASVADLDPVVFQATGSAPLSRLETGTLTGPMLDTLGVALLALDSLGAPQSGIPVAFQDITGFGEIADGPTTTNVDGEVEILWALGPTPGPQELTVVRTDINAELELVATATGQLDPWPFVTIAPGFYHTCAVDTDEALFCWGLNDQSQVGTEDTLAVVRPTPVPTSLSWTDLGGGEFHSCGLAATDDEVYCWGLGLQTGQEGEDTIRAPTIVGGGPWTSLAVGAAHGCALDAEGGAYCWGEELEGRLGNGVLEPIADPAAVSGEHVWSQLTAGHFHTCGVTEEGEGYCWGRGSEGQLGNGGRVDQSTPVLVAGGNTWVEISAGRFHSCGISAAGEAFCWGEGGFNQLGNGVPAGQTSPVKVSGGRQWTDIAAGQVHSCGVDSNQKLYCWGQGGFVGLGQFGAPTPAVVLPAYDWVSVHTKGIHTCAITTDGESYCWGSNESGQLGIGNTDDFLVPRVLVRGVISP